MPASPYNQEIRGCDNWNVMERLDMPSIEVNGRTIAYQQRGSGPTLLLLHSVLTDSRVWARQLDDLSDAYTVIAWDAPGSGQSADPPANSTISDYVETLAAFIDALEIADPTIVGAAWGTVLAFEYYRAHPEVPRALVLASAYAGWRGSLPLVEVNRRIARIREQSEMPPDAFVADWIPTLVAPAAPRDAIDHLSSIMRDMRPFGITTMMEAFANVDSRDVLPTITIPTLLIYGEGDRRAPVHIGHDLNAKIPGSKLVVVPGAAHMVYLEAWQTFDAEVRSFLTGKLPKR